MVAKTSLHVSESCPQCRLCQYVLPSRMPSIFPFVDCVSFLSLKQLEQTASWCHRTSILVSPVNFTRPMPFVVYRLDVAPTAICGGRCQVRVANRDESSFIDFHDVTLGHFRCLSWFIRLGAVYSRCLNSLLTEYSIIFDVYTIQTAVVI